jgi:site-specific DNA-methyltransferase (adenine-specific)
MLHGGGSKGGVQLTPYYEQDGITIYCGDCLDVMPELEPEVDAIIADLPYGTTACSWDSVIPLDKLWVEYKRLIKTRGAVVLTGSQPFTTDLINSNREWFKYEWVWNKKLAGNGILAKVQPLKIHENIIIFCNKTPVYNPQKITGKGRYKGGIKDRHGTFSGAGNKKVWSDKYHPTTILDYSGAGMRTYRQHPTQKPVDLMAYLIRTYTNPGEIVLDNTMGSGTTLVAAQQEGRRAIGIELSEDYCQIAVERLRQRSLFAVEVANDTNARQ